METDIAVYTTTYETLRAEKILLDHHVPVKPVIKPRSISSHCGMALAFDPSFKKKIVAISHNNSLELVGIFKQ